MKFSQMVFSLMQDVTTREMHLAIATVRKTVFKRRENRSEQTFYSPSDHYHWSVLEQNGSNIVQFEAQIENTS